MSKIALLFHVNFNHLSLSFSQRKEYIELYFESQVDLINIPVSFSICCEDLLLLQKWNPKAFNKFVTHPNIKFVKSLYSHAIPQIYPTAFQEQLTLTSRIYSDLIPSAKLLNICYSPEVDLPPSSIWFAYDGLILGETRVCINNLAQRDFPPIFYINKSNHKILGFISRRKFNYREYLHKLFRGETDINQTVSHIKEDYSLYSPNSVLIARIDWEVSILNQKIIGNRPFVPPYRVWKKLFSSLKSNNFEFYTIDQIESNSQSIPIYNYEAIHSSNEDNHKWSNYLLEKILKNFDTKNFDHDQLLIYNSLLCSDYYCKSSPDIIFPDSSNRDCFIQITKSRRYRDIESLVKLKLLTNKVNLSDICCQLKDKDLITYLRYYYEMITASKKYL